jgi:hypothetical protein
LDVLELVFLGDHRSSLNEMVDFPWIFRGFWWVFGGASEFGTFLYSWIKRFILKMQSDLLCHEGRTNSYGMIWGS